MKLQEVLQSQKIDLSYRDKIKDNRKTVSQKTKNNDQLKNVGLYIGYEVDSNTTNTIINFCEDNEIPECVEDDIQVPLIVSKRYSPNVKFDKVILKEDIYGDNFELRVEKLNSGANALVAYFNSDDLIKIRNRYADEYSINLKKNSKYRPYFVISKDIGNLELNLERLTVRLNEVLPYIVATQAFVSAFDSNVDEDFTMLEHAVRDDSVLEREIVNYNDIDYHLKFGGS